MPARLLHTCLAMTGRPIFLSRVATYVTPALKSPAMRSENLFLKESHSSLSLLGSTVLRTSVRNTAEGCVPGSDFQVTAMSVLKGDARQRAVVMFVVITVAMGSVVFVRMDLSVSEDSAKRLQASEMELAKPLSIY